VTTRFAFGLHHPTARAALVDPELHERELRVHLEYARGVPTWSAKQVVHLCDLVEDIERLS
jgi:hypothetical protein